jgi:hypothetical protein
MRCFAALSVLLVAGCQSDGARYNIEYASLSSELYIEAADGQTAQLLGGTQIGIDSQVGIGPDRVVLTPGQHWIRGNCPPPANAGEVDATGELVYIESTHGFGIGHDFEIGKAYVLRCVNGHPEISLRE